MDRCRHRPSGVRLLIALASAVVVIGVTGFGYLRATAAEQCGPVVEGTIIESQRFTDYEFQRGGPIDEVVIVAAGAELVAEVPQEAVVKAPVIGGRARQHTLVIDTGAVYSYFLDRPLGGLTRSEFIRLGGIELHQEPVNDAPFFVHLLSVLGDRAVPVAIGSLAGAITWADPDANGVRTHNVYWSDGSHDFALIADESAAFAVSLARSIVCKS